MPQVSEKRKQTTNEILMIRPAAFGANPQTAIDNAFHHKDSVSDGEIHQQALKEFDHAVSRLEEAGIKLHVFEDQADPLTPDAIFPNNWISFHQDGLILKYPMFADNRKLERRDDIIQYFLQEDQQRSFEDISAYEEIGLCLESTGSMVLDRINKIAFAGISNRTHPVLFDRLCEFLGWQAVYFHTLGPSNKAIYHTNVMMSIGSSFCVICEEVIRDQKDKLWIRQSLEKGEKEVMEISTEQMLAFAANILELDTAKGHAVIVLSETARHSFSSKQLQFLEKQGELLVIDVDIIETIGGGGIRCMMAEVF